MKDNNQNTGRIYRKDNLLALNEWFVDVDDIPHQVAFSCMSDWLKVCMGRDENRLIRFVPDNRIMSEKRVLFVEFFSFGNPYA